MTTKREKDQRRVRVTPESIENWLKHGMTVDVDLPKDARIVGYWYDETHWWHVFLFESAEWETLAEGERIPVHPVDP